MDSINLNPIVITKLQQIDQSHHDLFDRTLLLQPNKNLRSLRCIFDLYSYYIFNGLYQ